VPPLLGARQGDRPRPRTQERPRRASEMRGTPKLTALIAGVAFAALACHEAAVPVPSGADAAAQVVGSAAPSAIAIPGGDRGIGFDDLRFSRRLGRVLVPAGRTGNLCLVDPDTGAVQTIAGFGKAEGFAGGHGDGTTSVDEGAGLLFAIDRTAKQVVVAD